MQVKIGEPNPTLQSVVVAYAKFELEIPRIGGLVGQTSIGSGEDHVSDKVT